MAMTKNNLKNIVFSSNQQKILYFLLSHPEEQFYDRQIARLAGMSKSGTNLALRSLSANKLISRTKQGRMNFYSLNAELPVIKYLKIIQNLTLLSPLISKLKPASLKVVLFGSAAAGENTTDSDIDLFILSREPKNIAGILMNDPLREKINAIIKSPQEYSQFKKDNPIFYKEVGRGILLWQEM